MNKDRTWADALDSWGWRADTYGEDVFEQTFPIAIGLTLMAIIVAVLAAPVTAAIATGAAFAFGVGTIAVLLTVAATRAVGITLMGLSEFLEPVNTAI